MGKVQIVNCIESAFYMCEHPQIRTSTFYSWPSTYRQMRSGVWHRPRLFVR